MIGAFCVKSEDLTDQELNIMLEKCVALGATPCDWVDGIANPEADDCDLYARDELSYWGVTAYADTYTSNHTNDYVNNILSKQDAFELLGVEVNETVKVERKLKPFCVKSSDLTDQELNIMLGKCVELGADGSLWIKGFNEEAIYYCSKDMFSFWGVDKGLGTYTTDRMNFFENNILSKEEAFEMLGIETEETEMTGNKLKPFCVESDSVTEGELDQILKKCVELGAHQYEWVDVFGNSSFHYNTSYYRKDLFLYWGVDTELNTHTSDRCDLYYENNLLTKEEAFEMLGIPLEEKEEEGTFVDLLKEANCSLVINFPYITVIDKEANTHYNLPHEDEIVTFVNKLIDIKRFLQEEGDV